MSQAAGARPIWLGLLFCLAGVVLALELRATGYEPFARIDTADQCDFSQLARNLAEGRGFTTQVLFPSDTARMTTMPARETRRAPLWPLVLAAAFSIGGAEDLVASMASAGCAMAAILVLFLWVIRLGGSVAVAAAVALSVLLHPSFRAYGVTALAQSLQMLLFCSWLLALTAGLARPRGALLSGLLAGLLVSTNGQFLLLLPIGVVLHLRHGSGRTLALHLGTAIAVVLGLRAGMGLQGSSGSYGASLFMFTQKHPGLSMLLSPTAPAQGFDGSVVAQLWPKYQGFLVRTLASIGSTWHPAFALGALAVIVLPVRGTGRAAWEATVLLGLAALLLLPLMVFDARYYAHLLPPAIVLGQLQLGRALERLWPARGAQASAALVLAWACLVGRPWDLLSPAPRILHERRVLAEKAGAWTEEGDTVMSVLAYETAWYARRKSILLPRSPGDYGIIAARLGNPPVLLLRTETSQMWFPVVRWRAVFEHDVREPLALGGQHPSGIDLSAPRIGRAVLYRPAHASR